MKRNTTRNLTLALFGFVAALVATLFAFREPMQKLTPEGLEEARIRWSQQESPSYRLKYVMHGSTYEVSVGDDGQVQALVNGQPPTGGQTSPFVVEGIFDTLEMELDNLEIPAGPFAGRREMVLMRVRFHPKLGYVERYLRSSGGYGKGVSIEVLEFEIDSASD